MLAGYSTQSRYELDYWNLSYKASTEELIADQGRNQKLELCVSDDGSHGLSQALKIMRGDSISGIREDEIKPNYIISSSLYAQLYGEKISKDNYHLLFSVKAYNGELTRVYEKNGE